MYIQSFKDRFLTTMEHEEPYCVPTFVTITPEIAIKLGKEMNLSYQTENAWLSDRISHAEILTQLGNDAVAIGPTWKDNTLIKDIKDSDYLDDFGFVYKKIGYYFEIIKRPLEHVKSVKEIEEYKMPNPIEDMNWNFANKQINKYGKQYGVIGCLETTIFELSWNLVGMEKFLIDLYNRAPYIIALLDKVLYYNLVCGIEMVKLGVDMIWTGDDFGTQRGMLISPELWREIFKPRMHSLFNKLKKVNPNIKIAYHSCGSIVPIIPDLIEIGLDVLNPIQPKAVNMDLQKIKKDFGNELVLFGGVDEQYILPFGNTIDVEEEVKKRIEQARKGGGFIIAPAHNIQPDTPIENIYTYFNAVKKYGLYR